MTPIDAALASPDQSGRSHLLRRRRLIQGLMATGALGPLAASCSPDGDAGLPSAGSATQSSSRIPASDPSGVGRTVAGAVGGRVLVIVDLQGGNDGLSTLVPAGSNRYHDLRPDLAIEEPLAVDDEVGLHPALARLHRRGVATVEGVGPIDGDLSHFAMTTRWERGDVDGAQRLRTGFLGRLADTLDDGSPLVGASMAGPTPFLTNTAAATLSLNGRDDLWLLQPTDWNEATAFQQGLRLLGADRSGDAATIARGHGRLLDLAAALPTDDGDEIDWDLPMLAEGGDLGRQLYLAADLLAADLGLRVIYTRIGGFDTHDDHAWAHPRLMSEIDAAVDGFLDRVDSVGRGDDVVVATVSEFGRRVPENGAGLDHGSASTMVVVGAGAAGRFGEPPPLDDLDADDNLRVTIPFDRYLGALAESWLGVEAASVLPTEPEPVPLFA